MSRKKIEFKERRFQGENDILYTFRGHTSQGRICYYILLNEEWVHSVKTKALHERRVIQLVDERRMTETHGT